MIGAIVITHLLGIQFYIEMLFFLTHDHFGILGQKSASSPYYHMDIYIDVKFQV